MAGTDDAPVPTGEAEEDSAESERGSPALKWLGASLPLVLLGFAFAVLHQESRGMTWSGVRAELVDLPVGTVFWALALTALSYLVLTGYDALALAYARVKLARGRVVLASMLGYAFSQGLGFPMLTGTPVKIRLYSSWGLSAPDIARVVAFYTSTFWVGLAGISGASFLLWPVEPPPFMSLPGGSVRLLGVGLLAVLAALLTWSITRRGTLTLWRFELPIPSPPLVVGQIVVGAVDWVVAALVLWVLLPSGHVLGFGTFLSAYLLAQTAGFVSHVPAGLGVFEAVLLTLLPDESAQAGIIASLLAFRFVYYVVPMFLAVGALAIREVLEHRQALAQPTAAATRVASQLVPGASAALSFVLGAILLISGSVPVPAEFRSSATLPLPLLEASHFLGSVIGAALMLLARGLQLRLDGAWHVALALLFAATALSYTRDLSLIVPVSFALASVVLLASRREFYRRASLLDEPFTFGWLTSIATIVITSVWLGLFAYRHVDYSHDLWWQFALESDAPRFLRAVVGAVVTIALFVVARLLRPAPAGTEPTTPELLDRVAPIVRASPRGTGNLVFLGDKDVLLSESGRSFVMYGVARATWVAMGDPVGDPAEFESLAWELRDRADRAGDRLAFYQVSGDWLPLYIDLGFVFYKLGEEASVPLGGFTLEGKARADLRYAKRRLEKEGGTFEVVPPSEVESLLPALERISDEWLATKSVKEKRFSVGRFEPDYVRRFPCALIRVGGEIVAFATVWTSSAKQDLTVDLMRYGADAPKAVMDALFAHLLLWGAEEGYERFGLGMAPFSGMDTHRLSPAWQKMAAALYRYGEHFYNFQGLRDYKEKFQPEWETRYLAVSPKAPLARVLADVTSLISGGLRGAVLR